MSAVATPTPPPLLLTPNAIGKIKDLISEENNAALKLRVYVTGGGCSGFSYGFAFEETSAEAERLIEATRAALNTDGAALLDDAEIAALLGALQRLDATLAGSDSAAITAAKADLERLTDPFAARRMDHNIRTALAGRRVGEIGG
ncbi:MAG TPA: hypothetical protein PKE41_09075 [Candidatus Macondimonas sp.]|nr:hypothetical protein [Candidatus Macondimonas sp.]